MDQSLLTTLGRRNAQRICLRSDVGLLDEESSERTLGQMRDLSGTGCCVRTASTLPVGRQLRLAFELRPGEAPIRLHVEVIWSGRADGGQGGTLSGLRFLEIAGGDFARLRAFIDEKLWLVQSFLSTLTLLADLNDLEKLLLASVCYDRDLAAGESLDESAGQDALVFVRAGRVSAHEVTALGPSPARQIVPGDLCGALPIDPRGSTRAVVRAIERASLMIVPPDGFWYLWGTHSETALKLVSCWCLDLRDRLLVVEPR